MGAIQARKSKDAHIMSGWTECESVWGKHAEAVVTALKAIEKRLPFPIRSFYFDNGSEFLNENMINEFIKSETRIEKIKISRSRPYRKNDQCYVEQKNYTHVRWHFRASDVSRRALALMDLVDKPLI